VLSTGRCGPGRRRRWRCARNRCASPGRRRYRLANSFAGKVRDFLYIGDVTTYLVDLPNGQRIQALLPNSSPGRAKFFEVGDAVTVAWPAEAGVVLT
jgi:hypothetical protein